MILFCKKAIFFFITLALLSACKKQEGKGGKLTIKGKVYANFYNKTFVEKRGEGYLADEDVYIMYGDDVISGDDVKTSYDGSFEFKYLNKGKYKIYVYSHELITQKRVAVVKEIDLQENKELEDIIVNKEDKTFGTFAIRGKVKVTDLDDTYTFVDGPDYYALDQEVYLIEEGDSSYIDRVRTNYSGIYEFRGLRKGKYKVYVYSEGDEAIIPGGIESVVKDVEIVDSDLMLPDFNIIKN